MRLRWWEASTLVVPVLIAGLFYSAGRWVGATVLVCIVVFVAAWRAQIVERNVAGFHARTRGTIILLRATALFVVYGILVYGFWVMHQEHWTRDRHGVVAFYASAGLAIFLAREVHQLGDEADRWRRGGRMEEQVADVLDPLREEGWMVVHNVVRDDGGGNVDHFATAPGGTAFAIETKSGRPRAGDRGQAISNAIWAKSKFGARFVTAVVCVGSDPPERPTLVRHGNATVWTVGVSDLAAHLHSLAE